MQKKLVYREKKRNQLFNSCGVHVYAQPLFNSCGVHVYAQPLIYVHIFLLSPSLHKLLFKLKF
jgi:hypothetical protein